MSTREPEEEPMRSLTFSVPWGVALLTLFALAPCHAQKVPAPSREVFKCEENGKIVYSDAPCLGAKRVDVEPTRGLNKSTGSEKVGADVRRERMDEAMAKAVEPIFGETVEQRAKRHRRASLPAKAKVYCNRLDAEIPAAEQEERQSGKEQLPRIQSKLLKLRQQYKELKC